MKGGTFGAAVDTKDNAWLTSYGRKSIEQKSHRLTKSNDINKLSHCGKRAIRSRIQCSSFCVGDGNGYVFQAWANQLTLANAEAWDQAMGEAERDGEVNSPA